MNHVLTLDLWSKNKRRRAIKAAQLLLLASGTPIPGDAMWAVLSPYTCKMDRVVLREFRKRNVSGARRVRAKKNAIDVDSLPDYIEISE